MAVGHDLSLRNMSSNSLAVHYISLEVYIPTSCCLLFRHTCDYMAKWRPCSEINNLSEGFGTLLCTFDHHSKYRHQNHAFCCFSIFHQINDCQDTVVLTISFHFGYRENCQFRLVHQTTSGPCFLPLLYSPLKTAFRDQVSIPIPCCPSLNQKPSLLELSAWLYLL